jgi:hypothetical protein
MISMINDRTLRGRVKEDRKEKNKGSLARSGFEAA